MTIQFSEEKERPKKHLVKRVVQKRLVKRVVLILIVLLLLLTAASVLYFGKYYHASDEAAAALRSTEGVRVTTEKCGYCFDGKGCDTALVFYPGAKVEAASYAPLMRKLAASGIDCFLCDMPLNFALFGKNTANEVRAGLLSDSGIKPSPGASAEERKAGGDPEAGAPAEEGKAAGDPKAGASAEEGNAADEPSSGVNAIGGASNENEYTHWYIAGHSLGGVAAAMLVADEDPDGCNSDAGASGGAVSSSADVGASGGASSTASSLDSDTGAFDDVPNSSDASSSSADAGASASSAASSSSADDSVRWDGIIFLASYPSEAIRLPALSVYGSEDRVLDQDSYEKAGAKGLWPEDFTEKVIDGGNHAGFGDYGAQKGDGTASITADEQQTETIEAVLEFVDRQNIHI